MGIGNMITPSAVCRFGAASARDIVRAVRGMESIGLDGPYPPHRFAFREHLS